MELNDALTVTVLGISVVFIGLILTNLMIHSFSVLPRLARLFSRRPEGEAGVSAAQLPDAETPAVPVGPEIMAVITTVLEVELRLRASLTEGKFTFR